MTEKIKKRICDIHNELRNKQALGQVSPHYQTAELMLEIEWDDVLADFAQLLVRGCVMNHDPCRNTSKYLCFTQSLIEKLPVVGLVNCF